MRKDYPYTSAMPYVLLVCAFSLNAAANILLKLGSRQGIQLHTSSPVTFITANWQFLLGCLLFVGNVIFYFLALRSLPLSTAYPVMVVMSFLLIGMFAGFVLKEPISLVQIVGYGAIIGGLILIVAYRR